MPVYLPPGFRLQIKFTKAKSSYYLMKQVAESKTVLQFLDAQIWVKRIRPNPKIPLAHNVVLSKGSVARYNMTRVEIKSFTFSSGSQSLSIDNVVLHPIPNRLIHNDKDKDFLGSMDTNPYFFSNYDLQNFALYVNGKQIPGGGDLSLEKSIEKKAVMAYRTLCERSGIHHPNSELQITPEMNIKGYFMLLFDLTPDRTASEGHTSHPDNGNFRIELKFAKALPDAITCLIYLEYDGTVLIDYKRVVTTDY